MKQCEYCRNASPFQAIRCESCGAPFSVRTIRYKECQASAPSEFLYDSRVIDAEFIERPSVIIPVNVRLSRLDRSLLALRDIAEEHSRRYFGEPQ